jgi:hypothetical protein
MFACFVVLGRLVVVAVDLYQIIMWVSIVWRPNLMIVLGLRLSLILCWWLTLISMQSWETILLLDLWIVHLKGTKWPFCWLWS